MSVIQFLDQQKQQGSYSQTNPSQSHFGVQSSYEKGEAGEKTRPGSPEEEQLETDYEDMVVYDQENQLYQVFNIKNEEVVYEGAINDLAQNNKKVQQILTYYYKFHNSQFTKLEEDMEYAQDEQDIDKILTLILSFEKAFQLSKLHLLLEYTRILESNLDHSSKDSLIVIITDLMAQRPNFQSDDE